MIVALRRRFMLIEIKNILQLTTKEFIEYNNDVTDNNDDDNNNYQTKCLQQIRDTLIEVRIREMAIKHFRTKLTDFNVSNNQEVKKSRKNNNKKCNNNSTPSVVDQANNWIFF